jgi:hypothetical protein
VEIADDSGLVPASQRGGFYLLGSPARRRKRQSPAFRRGFANSTIQASATFVVLTAGLLAGVLRLLAGLLPAALLLATLVLATLVLTALLLSTLVVAALVLTALLLSTLVVAALVLTALLLSTLVVAALVLTALAGIVRVLIHHVLSCCPRPTNKMIAKQRFQSRQY